MNQLIYYVDEKNGDYTPLFEYNAPAVGADEFFARQLCNYAVINNKQYQLTCKEMNGDTEILVLDYIGENKPCNEQKNLRGGGIHIEFRKPIEEELYPLVARIKKETHFEVIRFLLKDIVDIPVIGQMYATSKEIDEDRGVYIIYVEPIEE